CSVLEKSMSNPAAARQHHFRVQQTLGVWGAGAAAQAQPAHSVLMRFCPFAQRTRLVLQHKQLPHQIVNLNSHLRLPDEDAHPEPPLYPATPGSGAAMRLAVARMGDSVHSRLSIDGPCGEETSRRPNGSRSLAGLNGRALAGPGWAIRTFLRLRPGQMARPDDLALDRAACRSAERWLGPFQLPSGQVRQLLGWTSRMEPQRAVKELYLLTMCHAAFFQATGQRRRHSSSLVSRELGVDAVQLWADSKFFAGLVASRSRWPTHDLAMVRSALKPSCSRGWLPGGKHLFNYVSLV
uniref:GST N-terminal domain-containing protein n=1 Tax=Macrostomum lignano TaxID=282301 RepID=A0A1I8FA98_9PLAT